MKAINIILTIIVVLAAIGLTAVALNNNALFGITGIAFIYFIGAGAYFLNCYTFHRKD
ncbi:MULTISPECIES: hypothetical protein [unclassified Lactobacillus]|uniref:hypothetical protein n=1 Tax=unclassified Lactobacillus TaxID=2620435 RepID=UPI00223FBC46|nr:MULTISPECIES: hypothetical protein [unclassified Lactobacillus]